MTAMAVVTVVAVAMVPSSAATSGASAADASAAASGRNGSGPIAGDPTAGGARTLSVPDGTGGTKTIKPRRVGQMSPLATFRRVQRQRAAARVAGVVPSALDTSATVSYVETTGGASGTIRRLLTGTTPANDPYSSPASSVAWAWDGSRYAVTGSGNTLSLRANGSASYQVDGLGAGTVASFDIHGETIAHTDDAYPVVQSVTDTTLQYRLDPGEVSGVSHVLNLTLGMVIVTENSSGGDRLVLVDPMDNTAAVPLVPDAPGAGDSGVQQRDAALSPNAEQIAYVQVAAVGGAMSVWVADFDGASLTNAVKVTDATVARGGVAWTQDGGSLYLLETAPSKRLSVVTAAASSTPAVLKDALGGTLIKSLSVQRTSVPITPVRLSGASRILTAIAISQDDFDGHPASGAGDCGAGQAEAVVLARSDTFPDGLSAGPLAVDRCAPLLLTPPTRLDPDVLTEIRRLLNPGQPVILIGSTGALSASVASALTTAGFATTRYFGANRYATAVAVANALSTPPSVVFLADGTNFPDALSAVSPAAMYGGAILLTAGYGRPADTTNYLNGHPVVDVFAVGGPAATAYGLPLDLVGSDRYDTAVKVAQFFFYPPAYSMLANGQNFPDALAGGPYAAVRNVPVFITPAAALPTVVSTVLDRSSAATDGVVVFGGPSVVSDTVKNQAVSLAAGMGPFGP